MKLTIEMIAARLRDLLEAARRERMPLGPARIAYNPPSGAHRPDYDDSAWETIVPGDRWGGANQTCWLRLPVQVPETWRGGRVVAHIVLGGEEHISGPEALAYLDGTAVQGIDFHHREIALDDLARPGEKHLLALEAFSPLVEEPQVLRALELILVDPEAEALYHDMRVLHGVLLTLPPESGERARLLHALERAYALLDLRRPHSNDYLRSVPKARAVLQREVYARGLAAGGPGLTAVGHAHIDLAWLWPVARTRQKAAHTFSTVHRLMERYPAYRFVASQPALYQMVKHGQPALYEQIKGRIAEGRWEATGATWVEMDCNLSGGEALIRQFLFGKRFFRQEFGADPHLLWLPDVFGYSAALPQIMKSCGVDYFMTTKISWNEYNRLPYDTFRWRGIDGSEVLTQMVTAPIDPAVDTWAGAKPSMYTYSAKMTPYDVAGAWAAYRQKDINNELLYLFGYGDGGGGPTAAMQETASRLAHLPGFPRVEQGSAEAFFRRLEQRVWNDPDLPTWVGELYLELHRGTYTSQGWIKRANRQAELLYREAELWSAAASLVDTPAAALARQTELNQGWEQLLFHQFHDILPGSSIPQVYADARAAYAELLARGERVRQEALGSLAEATAAQDPALLVINPAPFLREDPLEVVFPAHAALPTLRDDSGRPLPIQEIKQDERGRHALVGVATPPLGYRLCRLGASESQPTAAGSDLRITRETLENRFFILRLDEQGHIASLYDKRFDREVMAPGEVGNRLVAFEDRPIDFDAWDINLYFNDKPYPIDDIASWRVVEAGPLRGGVEMVRRYGQSTITQRILLYADVPRIDFPTSIDWHEQHTLLKAAFPVAINSPRATFDIQWGNIERPTHWNTSWDWARFETPAHKWADLSEGDYGVSLLNDCKYGYDVKDHTLRLTLLKSATWPDPEADQGAHEFSYALLPHQGDWRQGETVRQAYLFNMPAAARLVPARQQTTGQQAPGGSALPPSASFVATERPGLVIETVKPAEDGDGIIVRLYDAYNSRGPATLTFARAIRSAEECNSLEERTGQAVFAGHALHLKVRPYGISTFRVRLVDNSARLP